MARRTAAWPASLDLILDTVCNTFGCILLVALLVTILARQTGSRLAERVETLHRQAEREKLLAQHRAMQAEWDALRRQLAELPPNAEGLGHQEESLREECRQLIDLIAQQEHQRQKLDQTRKQAESQVAALQEKVEQARQKLGAAAQALKRHRQEVVLSMEREAPEKSHIAVVVRFGRMYFWHRYNALGFRAGLNTDEFLVLGQEGDKVLTQPKPYAGIPLSAADAEAQVARRLRAFSPRQYALDVAVWDDSFAEFAVLRRAALRQGFEYRLLVIPTGEALVDRGGRDIRVQ